MPNGESGRILRLLLLCAVLLCVLAFSGSLVSNMVYGYERAALTLAPSAARASLYGARHFSSAHAVLYNVNAAEYFYAHAAALDSSYPYVHHQRARIAFLRGDFGLALVYIDTEIEQHGVSEPNSYYVRGLIEGYMGRYAEAARDYAHYLESNPHNWAALNDYAWVLLKGGKYQEAANIAEQGLIHFPDNAWLLNSSAIANYEAGDIEEAYEHARLAIEAAAAITEEEWLLAYPGNDPHTAAVGVETLRRSTRENMHMIEETLASSTVQSR